MIKKLGYIFLIIAIVSCGSSKKTVETKKEEVSVAKKSTTDETIEKVNDLPVAETDVTKEEVIEIDEINTTSNEEKEIVEAIQKSQALVVDGANAEKALDIVEVDEVKKENEIQVITVTPPTVASKPLDKNLLYIDRSTGSPTMADKVIWTAVSYKGTPYVFGGNSKNGMDCSGLLYESFKKRGITIPRRSIWMYEKGYAIPLNEAKRGDLLFFNIPDKESEGVVNHVGLVTSNDNGDVKFIHAINSRGVVVSSILENYWNGKFVEAKRVIE